MNSPLETHSAKGSVLLWFLVVVQ